MPEESKPQVTSRDYQITVRRYQARPPHYPPRPALQTGLGPLLLPMVAWIAWSAVGTILLSITLPLWSAVLIAASVAAVLLALFIGQAGHTVMEINITATIALILALVMWPVLIHAREYRHNAKPRVALIHTP